MRSRRIFLASVALALALSGCDDSEALSGKVGQVCTVQFRRGDALGGGASMPVSPVTDNINGAQVSLRGTLRSAAGTWIVVTEGGNEYCIPRDSILLIRFENPSR